MATLALTLTKSGTSDTGETLWTGTISANNATVNTIALSFTGEDRILVTRLAVNTVNSQTRPTLTAEKETAFLSVSSPSGPPYLQRVHSRPGVYAPGGGEENLFAWDPADLLFTIDANDDISLFMPPCDAGGAPTGDYTVQLMGYPSA